MHRQMQHGTFRKSQTLVHLNGASVFWKDMQDGLLTAAEDAVDQCGDQDAGIAVAEVVGMRAHGADLCVAGKLETLARHGR
jgi:hypothetical protein